MEEWTIRYEEAKESANDILSLINERNLKSGPDASRITAAARRKLGSLGSVLTELAAKLETEDDQVLSENEKNRRRDLIAALRNRREQMLQALKRDNSRTAGPMSGIESIPGRGRETNVTAELDSRGLIQHQRQVIREQDTELEHLERSVVTTKHVALQINEETQLHNRLLDELDIEIGNSENRMAAAQRKLKYVMHRARGCKLQLLAFLLIVVLVVVVMLAFKIAIHL